MSSKKRGPSAHDLILILRGVKDYASPKVMKARERELEAMNDLNEFLASNKQYQRLKKVAEKADEDEYNICRSEFEIRDKRIRKIYDRIRLYGPTEKVIAEVTAIYEEFSK